MSVLIDAARGRQTPYTPIWFMRQAGRYQSFYQRIREKVSFLDLCKKSDLAAEITVKTVDDLGVDAAILFADILLIFEPLHIPFRFEEGVGPIILRPLTPSTIKNLPADPDIHGPLHYVMDTIRLARRALSVPLIGFAAAPFTLGCYAIEGKASKSFHKTKKLMFSYPTLWKQLMNYFTKALQSYISAQIDAGAQVIQLFDTWAGFLNKVDYQQLVLPYTKQVIHTARSRAVTILFATGNPTLYNVMAQAGPDVLGIDWRASIQTIWDENPDISMMGNLDPVSLLLPIDIMKKQAKDVLESAKKKAGHIFNLGHGILPETNRDHVRALVDFVHEATRRP